MASVAVSNPYTARRGSRTVDVSQGLFGQTKIYFDMFQRTGTGEWEVRGERHHYLLPLMLEPDKIVEQVVWRGSGISWCEVKGEAAAFACPPNVYNAINTCISVITADEHGMRH